MTLVEIYKPKSSLLNLVYNGTLVLLGSFFLAVSSKIYIPLPFTPVPITAQTLAVFLIGSSMGRIRGSISVLTYTGAGILGLPVFAGGSGGIARIIGPTGGYILGFLLAAYVIGYLAERGWDRNFRTSFIALLTGNIMIYLPGIIQLSIFTGWKNALRLGVYPFIIGDLVKILVAGACFPLIWRYGGNKNV